MRNGPSSRLKRQAQREEAKPPQNTSATLLKDNKQSTVDSGRAEEGMRGRRNRANIFSSSHLLVWTVEGGSRMRWIVGFLFFYFYDCFVVSSSSPSSYISREKEGYAGNPRREWDISLTLVGTWRPIRVRKERALEYISMHKKDTIYIYIRERYRDREGSETSSIG